MVRVSLEQNDCGKFRSSHIVKLIHCPINESEALFPQRTIDDLSASARTLTYICSRKTHVSLLLLIQPTSFSDKQEVDGSQEQ